jgi:hypothetical protein
MNHSNAQNLADIVTADPAPIRGPFSPAPPAPVLAPAQDAVTTKPPAAKGDDGLMSTPPVKPS